MDNRKIAIVGLGYVGLPMAVEFGLKRHIVGFDINKVRLDMLRQGKDDTNETDLVKLQKSDILFTSHLEDLRDADFYIIAVPTPVDDSKVPDLTPVTGASHTVGKVLKKGDIVVYESTVYPGCTEEDCVPILEAESGLKFNQDFFVGYSPERINPADKVHTFTTIRKIVSGSTCEVAEIVAQVYSSVVKAGVYPASSVKVAEAAKIIENTQRDINIALMNELSMIFHRLNIDTAEVLEAAGTKWNFMPFRPGLVGGHCIGVDPYYLTYKAQQLGYNPQVILSGRRINDNMGAWIAGETIKQMAVLGKSIKGALVTLLGLTFKEDCPDLRNSKVIDIIRELESYGVHTQITDSVAEPAKAREIYGVNLKPFDELEKADVVVVAVAHHAYKTLTPEDFIHLSKDQPLLVDVKSIYNVEEMLTSGIRVWRL